MSILKVNLLVSVTSPIDETGMTIPSGFREIDQTRLWTERKIEGIREGLS